MKDKKMLPATEEKERLLVHASFNPTASQKQTKELQQTSKEKKPAYQTYIYRSYGGGYQGL